MQHILLIDEIEKLTIKKDSSLMMALALKEMGHEVFLLFNKDFYIINSDDLLWTVYDFQGSLFADNCYIENFLLKERLTLKLSTHSIIHMRLDPPFDLKYLKTLWKLNTLENKGIKVVNSSKGILVNNEKIQAFESSSSLPTFIGQEYNSFMKVQTKLLNERCKEVIIKPLDSFQGQGVSKYLLEDFSEVEFYKQVSKFEGDLLIQPFASQIFDGEVRAIFYRGEEVGSILKVPEKGEYLANIVQGAKFDRYQLTGKQFELCYSITQDLKRQGVDLVAFDLIDHYVSEVNITCPGLLVETSVAHKENLAIKMVMMGLSR